MENVLAFETTAAKCCNRSWFEGNQMVYVIGKRFIYGIHSHLFKFAIKKNSRRVTFKNCLLGKRFKVYLKNSRYLFIFFFLWLYRELNNIYESYVVSWHEFFHFLIYFCVLLLKYCSQSKHCRMCTSRSRVMSYAGYYRAL